MGSFRIQARNNEGLNYDNKNGEQRMENSVAQILMDFKSLAGGCIDSSKGIEYALLLKKRILDIVV